MFFGGFGVLGMVLWGDFGWCFESVRVRILLDGEMVGLARGGYRVFHVVFVVSLEVWTRLEISVKR